MSILIEETKIDDSKDDLDSSNDKKAIPDILVELASQKAKFFCNEIEEGFAAIEVDNHNEVIKLRSKKFNRWLIKLYFVLTSKSVSQDAIKQAISTLEMFANFSGNEKKLEKRVAISGDDFYYDLGDKKWRAVKITKEGVTLENKPPILFTRGANMKEQVKPDLDVEVKELIEYVDKHFRFKTESDKVLFIAYLVSCFVAGIPHPILLLYGEKGAAKSTTMRMIKSIVDPAKQELFSLPTSKTDMALSLANNYMPIYDNIETISSEKSNMLCMAATGGAFSKRTLYTDEEESIVSFKRCVGFNGINIGATKSDLLDRCLLNELERIDETERKTEKEVWSSFEKDKPKILGACLKALSKAMKIYPTIKLDKLGRMADFTIWGYAIAEAIDIGGEVFLEAYLENQDKTNEEAISSHPVASSLIALMKDKREWVGSVSQLLTQLELVATREKINIKSKAFPKASHTLSKRLKEVKSNLEKVGIYFEIRHAGDYKKITVENINLEDSENNVNMIEKEKTRKEAAKRNQIETEVEIDDFVRTDEDN